MTDTLMQVFITLNKLLHFDILSTHTYYLVSHLVHYYALVECDFNHLNVLT
jgi:hypothetical protein